MTDIELFNYNLPDSLIAQRPAEKRDASRMMVLNRKTKTITHNMFTSFTNYLRAGDTLVINDTKVFPARLHGTRKTGGAIEILLCRRISDGVWETMVRGLKKLSTGETIRIANAEIALIEKLEGGLAIFDFGSDEAVQDIAQAYGETPLPPYISRPGGKIDKTDKERYQTVFAKEEGSCAAPTAGLHFTDEVLKEIRAKGVEVVTVTLHVGPATFKPVKTKKIEDHLMGQEPFLISESTAEIINRAKSEKRRVIAVGSTVTRALETSAQETGKVTAGAGVSSLYITPGFTFNVVDVLLTNFHLPKSTLLMMVTAFAGYEFIIKAYNEAVASKYRFFSYGDVMLLV
ncbi:S-adenosylmethionine:tRNA ribosyltransferase-isomerase [hydrothermal vent metagenome]|uniref:S-adenosylmethionine:tRNA ribosyltransferase-isomerase n=1 Tax=hydrothermal vent metagenome TaxID=652676 RepID=A0A3B1CK25_9ZZZZ